MLQKPPYIKICCIQDTEEARMAISYGASAIGLVGKMPSGPGPISDENILKVASVVPPPVATFLLTSETEPDKIVQHQKRTHTSVIQLVDHVEKDAYQFIKRQLPSVKLVQVIHVQDKSAVDYAAELEESVDALLLDSGNPGGKIKSLGGTGRTHNWEISREIVEISNQPVFLAGGLNPENVKEAVIKVKPFGIDVCSGVRTNGKLDEEKLMAFVQTIKQCPQDKF
jgi:phosphoribosylanthranilate isomerase